MNAAGNYELLIGKINTFIRKYYLNKLLRGLIFLGAGLFSAYVVIALGEYFGNFNTVFRTILFYFFILLNLFLLAWLVIPPLLAWLKLGKTLSHRQAAEIIGRHFTDVNDKLLNTLQLKKLALDNPEHSALIEAGIDQKIEALKPVSFPSAINIRENNRYLKWVILPATIICILALAAPSVLTESTKRLIRHNEYFAPVAPFSFVVLNPSLSVVQGQDFKLDVKLSGNKIPADVYVQIADNTFKLDKENLSRFHYLFSNLQQNTAFKLTANGFTSAPYQLIVNPRPSLLHFDVQLNYPAYLHKKNETIANAGDLTIPAGTIVNWAFHTQNASGLIFNIDGKTQSLGLSARDVFEHHERIIKNTQYKINPVNTLVKNSDSASYRINVIADEPPTISVEKKSDSVSMNALYFTGKIQDDHGFSSLIIHFEIGDPGDKKHLRAFTLPVKADLSHTQADFFYYWDLKQTGIKPGDQVSYYFEVADNDEVSGPKKARTPEQTLNMPDERELNNQLNAGTQAVKQKMESAIKLAGQVEHDSQKLNELLLNKNTISFDEKKEIEDLLQKKKDLDDLVKDIQDENKKNQYNRQQNQQQAQQLTEKQQEMAKLLDNVLDPKTQQMLQNLQQLLQNDQKDDTRNELSKMQMDNKSLRKELDRMLELYKKLELDQKLAQNVNQLNQLAQQQQNLADSIKKPNTDLQTAQQEQQKLNNNFQDIKKSLSDLQKENEQNENKSDLADPSKDEKNIDQQMQQSADELQKNNSQKASQSQQQAAKQIQQLAGKLKQSNEDSEEAENTVDAEQLRELLKNLVNSSFQQEDVMQTLKTTSTGDPNYITLAQKQKDIKDNLKTAEDSLYALSRRIPQIQSTVNKEVSSINDHIDQALQNLGDRQTPQANSNQQFAMTSMNNLALMLSEALEQLQNMMKNAKGGGKGKGKQQSIAQLAKMQQELNNNMQKARDQMQKEGQQGSQGKNGKPSQQDGGMSEQLAKMARQQQMIREMLQQINQDENQGGAGKLGNLDKISQQMEQNERDLVNRKITDEALKRQQQIQSRLLEADKADQQREQDQQRESHAGKDMPPGYIKALQDYQQVKAKQTEQIRTVPPALNLYYKQKINLYFDQLNAK